MAHSTFSPLFILCLPLLEYHLMREKMFSLHPEDCLPHRRCHIHINKVPLSWELKGEQERVGGWGGQPFQEGGNTYKSADVEGSMDELRDHCGWAQSDKLYPVKGSRRQQLDQEGLQVGSMRDLWKIVRWVGDIIKSTRWKSILDVLGKRRGRGTKRTRERFCNILRKEDDGWENLILITNRLFKHNFLGRCLFCKHPYIKNQKINACIGIRYDSHFGSSASTFYK